MARDVNRFDSATLVIVATVVLGGLFCVVAAAADWDLFFDDRRARWLVELAGRDTARQAWAAFGIGAMGLGVYLGAKARRRR